MTESPNSFVQCGLVSRSLLLVFADKGDMHLWLSESQRSIVSLRQHRHQTRNPSIRACVTSGKSSPDLWFVLISFQLDNQYTSTPRFLGNPLYTHHKPTLEPYFTSTNGIGPAEAGGSKSPRKSTESPSATPASAKVKFGFRLLLHSLLPHLNLRGFRV